MSRRPVGWLGIAFLGFALAAGAARAETITLTPDNDALVLTPVAEGRTLENWGGANFLEVDSFPSEIDLSFVRFDLSGVHFQPASAVLDLQVTSDGSRFVNPTPVSIFAYSDVSWAEGTGSGQQSPSGDPTTGITGANFGNPFLDQLDKARDRLATATPTGPSTDVLFDLSGYDLTAARAAGFLTLAIALDDVPTERAETLIDFWSREGDQPARLILDGSVPEPATLALLALGAIPLARRRRP